MGKRLYSQRRGRGTNTFKAKLKGIESKYILQTEELLKGQIIDFIKDTGRNAIIQTVEFNNGKQEQIIAVEGAFIGQKIEQGPGAKIELGNVIPIGELPEGCPVFNIERILGDGGTISKSSGTYSLIISKDKKGVTLKLASGKMLTLPLSVRATIGNVSCGGKQEKPFIKAGTKYFAMKAKKIFWPSVRGVAMNAVDHPFGGAQHHPGKSKSTARNAPVGRKVGAIASRRTGRRKKN
ncbi:MAG: 50S ribosomal protein L2 [Candidatus ainarchaeum sp.]|nr:50S ribosomal protein L2 [Candidatus ainarchaeum sp.]